MNGYAYDTKLDRLDVAVRAAVKLCAGGRKKYAARVGLKPEHFPLVQDALLDIDTIRTEDGVMDLLKRCPFLLDAALEILRLYQTEYTLTREYTYARR